MKVVVFDFNGNAMATIDKVFNKDSLMFEV